MPDSYAYSPGGSSTPGLDTESLLMLHNLISPVDAESLVTRPTAAPPPSTAPKTEPGQTTPQTGSLATPPQQAQPKVSGPPMIPGVATEPEKLPSAQPRSGLSRAFASGNANPGQAGGIGLAPEQVGDMLSGRMSADKARGGFGNPSGMRPNSSAPPSSMTTTGETAAPLNLGPATLAPQVRAQQQAYGSLMQLRARNPGPTSPGGAAATSWPSSAGASNPSPALPATASNLAPPAQQRLAQDQARLDNYQRTGPGVDQIKNRWMRILGKTADIAGSIFTPGIAQWVPGSTLHNMLLQGIQRQRVAGDQDAIQAAAQTADLASQTALRNQQAAADAPRAITHEEAAAMGDPSLEGQSWTPRSIEAYTQGQQRNAATLKGRQAILSGQAAKAGLTTTWDNGAPTFSQDPNAPNARGQRTREADTYGLKGEERAYYILTGKMHDPQSRTGIHIPSAESQEYNDWKRSLGHPPTTGDLAGYRRGNRGNVNPADTAGAQDRTRSQPQSQPATKQTARPGPDTHSFSVSQWRRANPRGDADAAIAKAKKLGYPVVQ